MTKELDLAIKKVRELPPRRQRDAAAMLLTLVEQEQSDLRLSPEQVAEVDEAMAERDFLSHEEVRRLFKKYGVSG